VKLLIMQSSPAFCHFVPRRFKYSPPHLILKHLNLRSYLSGEDELSIHTKP
jgi:hypothetical protein